MENRKPRVVFTFVEAGMGHLVPATGISDAFEKKYGDKCEVIRWKIYSGSKNQEILNYHQSIISDTKKQAKHKIYAFLFHWLSEIIGRRASQSFTDRVFKRAVPHVLNEIRTMNPDLIFSTFCSPSHFAVRAKKAGLINSIIGTYTPDPIVHNGWDKNGDIFIVNNDQAYKIAKKEGFRGIYQVPFILRKEACEIKESKTEMRAKLGLPKNKFTIVLCDGAYGQKNLVKFTEELIKLDYPITVISVCGKNEQAFAYLSGLKENVNKNITFLPLGFTTNMLEYNRASDLFIGKGGANALVESFFFGSPAIVSSYANELERFIANYYITQLGCGEIIKSKKKFVKRIKEILENKEILNKYRENLKVLQDNTGAEKAADVLFNALKEKFKME
jgi:UDP-N-acetylglucosamine:LPS N-acetylglucosamine transferase